MRKLCFIAVLVSVFIAAYSLAEEAKKPPTPLQLYLKDKGAEKFVEAHTAYIAQLKDSTNFSAISALAWLHLFELERYLDIFAANEAKMTNMQRFQYANVLLELDRCEDAIAVYEKINEANPKWSCPWRHKGEAYFKMKNYPEAEKALLRAIETRSTHYDAYMWLAEVYNEWGKYEEGLKMIELGLEQYGKDVENPEEEYSSAKVALLHLDLLKGAGKSGTDAYRHALEHARKLAPDDPRLANY